MALGLILGAGPALAQPSAQEKDTARELVRSGNRHMLDGSFEEALTAYQGADAIMGVPTTGLGVARAQLKLGRLVAARKTLVAVVDLPKKKRESRPFVKARRQAAELSKQLLERIPTVKIELDQAEARVWIDEVSYAPASLTEPVPLDPGKYHVRVEAEGFAVVHRTVRLTEGKRVLLSLSLHPLAAADPQPTPAPTPVQVADDAGAPFHVPIFVSGVSVAVVGIVVGAATGAASMSLAEDVDAQCDGVKCPADLEADIDRSTTLAHVSTASFVFAGLGAAATIASLFINDSNADAASAPIRVRFGAGIVVEGSF